MKRVRYRWILRLKNTTGEPAKYYFNVYEDQVDIIQYNLHSGPTPWDVIPIKVFKGKTLVRRTMGMRLSTFKRLNMFVDDVIVNQLLPQK